MNQTEIDELRRLHEAATPGPWRWRINRQGRVAEIESPKEGGWTIMGFERWGMDGACPSFRMEQNGHSLLTRADQMAVDIPGREHHREWFQGIDNVDANLMTAARNAIPRLLAALEEARAERGMLKKSLRLLDRITDGREQSNGTDPEEIQIVVERFHALKAERDEWEGRAKERAKTQLLTACDLKDAKTERDALKEKLAAMDLLLNNAERVVRDGIADRDAAESLAWDALGRPEGTHDTTNVQRLCEAHGALKAKLAEARAERLGYRAEYLELLRRIREGQLVTATEASMRYEGIIAASSEEPL